jgi:hypothetical protein
MVGDPLDAKIELLRHEVAQTRATLEALETTLRAYEDAARLRPGQIGTSHQSTAAVDGTRDAPRRGGRQKGAISKTWRKILGHIVVQCPNGGTPDVIASFGRAVGLPNLRSSDVRLHAKKYMALGYLEQIGDLYKVTEAACERFRLLEAPPSAPPPPPNPADIDPDEGGLLPPTEERMAAE